MEFVINKSNLRNLRIESKSREEFVRGRLLNSNYKRLAEHNLTNANPKSIFGIRQGVKFRTFQSVTGIETILKVAVFATLLGFLV